MFNRVTCAYGMHPPAPSPPTNVAVYQNGLSTVLVTWTLSPGSNRTGYTVFYQQVGGLHSGSVMTEDTANSVVITELNQGATYSISVVANSSTLPSNVATGPDATIGIHKILSFINFYRFLSIQS